MQFSTATSAHTEAAQLFVCTEAAQLKDETAKLLFQSLEDGQSFTAAALPVAGSLHHVALLRLDDLSVATLQKAAKEAAAWAQKQPALSVDLNPFCAENAPCVAAALAAALGEAAYRFDRFKSEAKPAKLVQAAFVHAEHAGSVQAALNRA